MKTKKRRGRKLKAPASVPDRPHLLEWLKDAQNAAGYVEAAIQEGDREGILQALRDVAEVYVGTDARL